MRNRLPIAEIYPLSGMDMLQLVELFGDVKRHMDACFVTGSRDSAVACVRSAITTLRGILPINPNDGICAGDVTELLENIILKLRDCAVEHAQEIKKEKQEAIEDAISELRQNAASGLAQTKRV